MGHCSLAVVTFLHVGTLFTLQMTAPNKFTIAVFSERHYLSTEASVTAHDITVHDGVWFSVTLPADSPQGAILFISFTVAR